MCDYQICQVVWSSSRGGRSEIYPHKTGPWSRAGSQPGCQLCLTPRGWDHPPSSFPILSAPLLPCLWCYCSLVQPLGSPLWCPPVFFPSISVTQLVLPLDLLLIVYVYLYTSLCFFACCQWGMYAKDYIYLAHILILLWMPLMSLWMTIQHPGVDLSAQVTSTSLTLSVCTHGYIQTLSSPMTFPSLKY